MIPLLAQAATQSVPLQIPGAVYGLSVAVIGGVGALLLVAGKLLKGLRELRSGVAGELKREIETASAAQRVDVQQPLTVTPFVDYVRKPDYDRDMGVVDDRLNAATESRKKLHERVDAHSQRIASLEKGERNTEVSLANIDQKLTVILQRLPKQ